MPIYSATSPWGRPDYQARELNLRAQQMAQQGNLARQQMGMEADRLGLERMKWRDQLPLMQQQSALEAELGRGGLAERVAGREQEGALAREQMAQTAGLTRGEWATQRDLRRMQEEGMTARTGMEQEGAQRRTELTTKTQADIAAGIQAGETARQTERIEAEAEMLSEKLGVQKDMLAAELRQRAAEATQRAELEGRRIDLDEAIATAAQELSRDRFGLEQKMFGLEEQRFGLEQQRERNRHQLAKQRFALEQEAFNLQQVTQNLSNQITAQESMLTFNPATNNWEGDPRIMDARRELAVAQAEAERAMLDNSSRRAMVEFVMEYMRQGGTQEEGISMYNWMLEEQPEAAGIPAADQGAMTVTPGGDVALPGPLTDRPEEEVTVDALGGMPRIPTGPIDERQAQEDAAIAQHSYDAAVASGMPTLVGRSFHTGEDWDAFVEAARAWVSQIESSPVADKERALSVLFGRADNPVAQIAAGSPFEPSRGSRANAAQFRRNVQDQMRIIMKKIARGESLPSTDNLRNSLGLNEDDWDQTSAARAANIASRWTAPMKVASLWAPPLAIWGNIPEVPGVLAGAWSHLEGLGDWIP